MMKKLVLGLLIFSATLLLESCACNGGCDLGLGELNLFSGGGCSGCSNCTSCSGTGYW